MPIKTRPSGPIDAKIMLIGEAPGAEEEVQGVPFVGNSGKELTKMLHEAGILITECYLTNVCKYRPPGNDIETFFLDSKLNEPNELIKEGVNELLAEIDQVKPKLILCLGNTPLWALRGHRAITKWRGSMLYYKDALLMPAVHPSLILRDWSQRAVAVHDFKRALRGLQEGKWPVPEYQFQVRPSYEEVMDTLGMLIARADKGPLRISSDIETRIRHIACHGIAWSRTEAICIPYMCTERRTGYWSYDQELDITLREQQLLQHPNARVIGQNYLYDAQYFARRRGYAPRLTDDTMHQQHIAFAGSPKGLDYLSSLYCQYHQYWKDEGKNWDISMPEEQYWTYNCKDAVTTFEVQEVLEHVIARLNLQEQYKKQMKTWWTAFYMMLEGVPLDKQRRADMGSELLAKASKLQSEINFMLGHELNVKSPPQVHGLFYGSFKCSVVKDKKTKKPTCNDEALRVFAEKEPLLKPLTVRISDLRSVGVVYSNVLKASMDEDGKIRCTFDPTAETNRWKSYENAFGGGTNLQNWTKGSEDDEVKDPWRVEIPNTRKTVCPPPGYEFASMDLSGADAQTVAWEANDEDLKRAFRSGVKIHAHNNKMMFPDKCPIGTEEPYYTMVKAGCHLLNYGGKTHTLAITLKNSDWFARQFEKTWFDLHPGIRDWHDRIQDQLMRTRTVTNKFGFRRFYFDRIEDILPEALAWIGQSTTAGVTNEALNALKDNQELLNDLDIHIPLQVHDEILLLYPTANREQVLRAVKPIIHITVPYDDPLIIPWGLKISSKSWGECEKYDWPV